ncbi:MAG: sugar phosphate isomerase/epimerase family protein [Acidobacteriota bacterium]
MKISLGSWAFSFGPYAVDPVSFEDTVRHLSAAGYDGVDICGFPPHISLASYPTREARRQVVRLLQDYRLGVSGYSADFSEVNPIARENEAAYADLFRRNLEMSVDLGSPSLRVDTVAAPGSIPDDEYEEAFHRIARLWADGAELAAKAGVRVVWEFEPGFAFNKPAEIIRMHQEVRHPNFSILFDTSHAYMCAVAGARQHGERDVLPGGVAEFLDKLQGRIGAIHLIDSDGTLHCDETSTHRPFGEGLIDFERLAPKLLSVPDIEWWTIDHCFWAGSWELVASSRQFVAGLLERASR